MRYRNHNPQINCCKGFFYQILPCCLSGHNVSQLWLLQSKDVPSSPFLAPLFVCQCPLPPSPLEPGAHRRGGGCNRVKVATGTDMFGAVNFVTQFLSLLYGKKRRTDRIISSTLYILTFIQGILLMGMQTRYR
jgi:hypothetical protein